MVATAAVIVRVRRKRWSRVDTTDHGIKLDHLQGGVAVSSVHHLEGGSCRGREKLHLVFTRLAGQGSLELSTISESAYLSRKMRAQTLIALNAVDHFHALPMKEHIVLPIYESRS